MAKFKVPVRWEVYGYIEIEAENLDAACDEAYNAKLSDANADYVQGSFEVDYEGLDS